MDPTRLAMIAEVLKASGPYGLVAVLGWAFWRINEKKDRELKILSQKVVAMAEAQTTAIYELKAVMHSLSQEVSRVAGKLRLD